MSATTDHHSRLVWYLNSRRLKSCKFVLVAVALMNLLLLLTLAWRSIPQAVSTEVGPAEQLDIFHDSLVVQKRQDPPVKVRADNLINVSGTENLKSRERNDHHTTACSFRTAVYMSNRHIHLNKSPFVDYVKLMTCHEDGDIACFAEKFVRFNNVIVDPAKILNARKGGEKIEEVWNQKEEEEYFKLTPGFFKAPCKQKPRFVFSHIDHLVEWARVLECYRPNKTDRLQLSTVPGTTLAIQRYEYVNLYHTMTDFYNAFVLMLLFGVSPSKVNILAVDAHPEGTLDSVWEVLFGKFIRAGRLQQTTHFPNFVWGLLGYSSPLNEHERESVPYLDEFRHFFLSRYNITTDHRINCARLNVILIWRRDYVAHPRNPKGSVVRKFANEAEMVQEVKNTLGQEADVQGVQLDNMPMADQLKYIAKADILIGMHGAGLSHILFLPATSGVIELKPEYSNPSLLHFQAMARWRNLPYQFWHNFDPKNELSSYRTYIPRDILKKMVVLIHKQICG